MTSSEIKRILSNVISEYFDQIDFDKLSDDQQKLLRDLADSIQKRFASRINKTYKKM